MFFPWPKHVLQNLYALSDLGMSILRRLAPKQHDLQDLSASVTLPSGLFKQLAKEDENETPVRMVKLPWFYMNLHIGLDEMIPGKKKNWQVTSHPTWICLYLISVVRNKSCLSEIMFLFVSCSNGLPFGLLYYMLYSVGLVSVKPNTSRILPRSQFCLSMLIYVWFTVVLQR